MFHKWRLIFITIPIYTSEKNKIEMRNYSFRETKSEHSQLVL